MFRTACPSASRLLAFALGELQNKEAREIEFHLQGCPNCRVFLENIRGSLPENTNFFSEPAPDILRHVHSTRSLTYQDLATATRVSEGDIWLARSSEGNRRLILVLDEPKQGIFTAALISPELDMATDRDLIFAGEQSPLGYPIMVEAWNSFPLLTEQCLRYLGKLDRKITAAIRLLSGTDAQKRLCDLQTGSPMTDTEDPRVDFQLEETFVAHTLSSRAFARLDEEAATTEQIAANVSVQYTCENTASTGINAGLCYAHLFSESWTEPKVVPLVYCYDEKNQPIIDLVPATLHNKCKGYVELSTGTLSWEPHEQLYRVWFTGTGRVMIGPKEELPTKEISAGSHQIVTPEWLETLCAALPPDKEEALV